MATRASNPPTGATRRSALASRQQKKPPLVLDAATCILADYHRGPEYDALQELIPPAFFKSMGYTGSALTLGGAFVGQNSDRARAVCPAVAPRWQWRPDHRHGHRRVRPTRRLPRWR